MYIIISYDIADDRRRTKTANILEDYGDRVQYSVFECIIDQKLLDKMTNRLQKVINIEEDSIRIYKMCNECYNKITILGKGEISKNEDVYII